MDNNKFLLMALREAANPHKFHRHPRTTTTDSPSQREQIIPNKIVISDHSPLTPSHPRNKKKHPLLTLKTTARQQLPQRGAFPIRAKVPSFDFFQCEGRGSLSRVTLRPPRKKTESSLSLFNKLILTPFNFIRPKPHPNSASTNSLKNHQRKTFFHSQKYTPKSEDRKGRPSPYHRTLQEWSRGGTKRRVQQGEAFKGWQTSPLEGDDFI